MALELTVISIEDMSSGPTKNVYEQDEIGIGRASINDLVLNKPEVSGRHTRIRVEYDENDNPHIYVTDLGSLNGTTIEGKRLEPQIEHEMSEGQRIGIGSFIIRPKIFNFRNTISEGFDSNSLWQHGDGGTLMAEEDEHASITKEQTPFLAKSDFGDEEDVNDTEEALQEHYQEKSPFLTMEDFEKSENDEDSEVSERESAAELFEDSLIDDVQESEDEIQNDEEYQEEEENFEEAGEDDSKEEIFDAVEDEAEDVEEAVEEEAAEEEENDAVFDDTADSFEEEAVVEEGNNHEEADIIDSGMVTSGENVFNFDAIRLCSISGNVSHKSKGLEGVELVLTINDDEVRKCHTAKNGQFTFDDIEEGTKYNIVAKKEGYKIVADNADGTLDDDLLVQFESCKFFKLSGRVTCKGSGVAGVIVKSDTLGSTTTDEDGNFEFADVKEDTEYSLEFKKGSYKFETRDNSGTLTKDQNVEVSAIKLIPVEGVIYYKGKPLAGVEIDGGPIGKTVTGEDGRYCFPDVPEGTQYTLVARKEGYKFAKH